ncbi:hypothetical protein PGB90_006563 [Kerria lacca]
MLATVLEGMAEGKNCKSRPRQSYEDQILKDTGCKSFVEMNSLAQETPPTSSEEVREKKTLFYTFVLYEKRKLFKFTMQKFPTLLTKIYSIRVALQLRL